MTGVVKGPGPGPSPPLPPPPLAAAGEGVGVSASELTPLAGKTGDMTAAAIAAADADDFAVSLYEGDPPSFRT